MKKLIYILIFSLLFVYQSLAGNLIIKKVEAVPSCNCLVGVGDQWTQTNENEANFKSIRDGEINYQYVANTIPIRICKLRIYLHVDGADDDLVVGIWDSTITTQRGSSLSQTISTSTSIWYEFEWTENYPEPGTEDFVVLMEPVNDRFIDIIHDFAGATNHFGETVINLVTENLQRDTDASMEIWYCQ